MGWGVFIYHSISTFPYEWAEKEICSPISEGSLAKRLFDLCQGIRSIAEFLVKFQTVAATASWPDNALQGVFLQGLNDQMKGQLAFYNNILTHIVHYSLQTSFMYQSCSIFLHNDLEK